MKRTAFILVTSLWVIYGGFFQGIAAANIKPTLLLPIPEDLVKLSERYNTLTPNTASKDDCPQCLPLTNNTELLMDNDVIHSKTYGYIADAGSMRLKIKVQRFCRKNPDQCTPTYLLAKFPHARISQGQNGNCINIDIGNTYTGDKNSPNNVETNVIMGDLTVICK